MASIAMGWTSDFSVRGLKTEPTFIEHVQYGRRADRFSLDAVIHGQQIGAFSVDLEPDGRVRVAACPLADGCAATPPNGFLSTVAVLAALRAGLLTGSADVVSYAGRDAMCVPLEALQPDLPTPVVLDPCLDLETGAVLAHRRRFDHGFGGATLDESSLVLTSPILASDLNPRFRK
jgi:hypothetical protein